MMTKEKTGKYGFSLVEITIALLVIAVGILAVFGLMGDALRANTKTLDDTIAATFAESVFSSIFATDWEELKKDGEVEILMGENFWPNISDDPNQPIQVPAPAPTSFRMRYKPVEGEDYPAIEYYPLTYQLTVEKQKGPLGNTINSSTLDNDAVWRAWRLRVWIGEFADTSDKSDPYEFYTEQYKFIDPSEEYENQGGTGN